MEREILKPDYLGDGVYVHDKGYGLSLAVNHHLNEVIFLEDTVLLALINYAKRAELIK